MDTTWFSNNSSRNIALPSTPKLSGKGATEFNIRGEVYKLEDSKALPFLPRFFSADNADTHQTFAKFLRISKVRTGEKIEISYPQVEQIMKGFWGGKQGVYRDY